MKTAHLLGFLLALAPATLAGDGVDASRSAPFPNPRHSGSGRVAFTSMNVQLLGWKTLADFPGGNISGNDCWGYTSLSGREYAIIGLSHGTGFVEVTDPGLPVIVDYEARPAGVSDSLWRCVKVYQHYAYAGSEAGGGIQIFNLTNIDSGVVTSTSVSGSSCTTATHSLALDEVSGFLYRCGGGGTCGGVYQGLQIYSLANPASPTLVGQWNAGRYVHEAHVVTWDLPGIYLGKQIAFCFTEDTSGGTNPRLQILDVTNKASISQISSTAYTGSAFSHQGWLSFDKQYLYLNDELDDDSFGGARTRLFSVSNLAAPSYNGWFSSGATSIDHNLYVLDNRIYESNYRSGLRVFDSSNPATPTAIGYFDTWPEDDDRQFNSLWSNFPYFASGTIIGSDIEKGLFVWRYGTAKLTFAFPGGLPAFIGTGGGTLEFEVNEESNGDLLGGTVEFHYSTGGPFTTVSATPLGGNLYQATLPAASCGAPVDYYVSAQSNDLVTWTDPPAGPTQVHMAVAAFGEIAGPSDDFEANTGWQVNLAADLTGFATASTGTWVRANPVGTAAQPEDDHSSLGTNCFVTANGAVGGGDGDADIDGGATSVRSPALDASGLSDPYVEYWRWYSNSAGAAPGEDTMTVHISNNGGSSWVLLETIGPTGADVVGGWILHRARIADFVAPTNNMRLRFRASDLINGSIVEAAIDDLRIFEYDCTPPGVTLASVAPASGPLDGGNVVTLTGTNFQAGSTVFFGANQAAAVNVVSATTIQVLVPRANGPVSGKLGRFDRRVDVTVQNPGSATLTSAYTYAPLEGP